MWTFAAHGSYTARKASSRLSVLRALSNSLFGHNKKCLTLTFKSMIWPFFDFAAPIVFPNYSPSPTHKLQLVQNKCLRLITGCHTASAIDHHHSETQILPVERHLSLLSSQYFVCALNPNHPSHPHVAATPPANQCAMKNVLRSKCWPLVENFLQNRIICPKNVKRTMNDIHINIIGDTINSFAPNRVLGTIPPLIDLSESVCAPLTLYWLNCALAIVLP